MSARSPRFEVVHSDAGWFARFRAANGRIVLSSEVYTRKESARGALGVLFRVCNCAYADAPIVERDERGGEPPAVDDPAALGKWSLTQPLIANEIKGGRKIHAIKELRAATGASLYWAKAGVEAAQALLDERTAR